jgi:hypothetical protein
MKRLHEINSNEIFKKTSSKPEIDSWFHLLSKLGKSCYIHKFMRLE